MAATRLIAMHLNKGRSIGQCIKDRTDYAGELVNILKDTFDKGGNVVIPSFAVGRTQELLYFLRKIKTGGTA